MSNVQTSGDVRRGEGDIEKAIWLWLPTREDLGLEKTLSQPPVIPRRLNSDGIITVGHRLGEICRGKELAQ
jgi:hypothetical protein